MNGFSYISGIVEVELVSAEPETVLGILADSGIALHRIRRADALSQILEVKRKDYRLLCKIAGDRGDSLSIRKKRGIYWIAADLLNRPVLLMGCAVLLLLTLLLPQRILIIRVKGNLTVPSHRILSAAETCGIRFGVSRRSIRNELMKNTLLSVIPQLQWAGINTRGCVAEISVREGFPRNTTRESGQVSSIVAALDGYIESCTATRGTALCETGQTVRKGQVLISGYTDSGISIRAEAAEGEIFAQTYRSVQVLLPALSEQRTVLLKKSHAVSLLIGKKRINLWKDSGIWDSTCGRMYEEYYLPLPGGFCLPVAVAVDTLFCYETESRTLSPDRADMLLREFAGRYIKSQMISGTILKEQLQILEGSACYILDGNYRCSEMIGRDQPEKIGEFHGKKH